MADKQDSPDMRKILADDFDRMNLGTGLSISYEQLADQIIALYAPVIKAAFEEGVIKTFKAAQLSYGAKIEQLQAEIQALHRERKGEVWYWQGDGEDKIESLTCPILIEVRDFRDKIEQAVKEEHDRMIKCCVNEGNDAYKRGVESGKVLGAKEERERIETLMHENINNIITELEKISAIWQALKEAHHEKTTL